MSCKHCGARVDHLGDGQYGIFHSQNCPKFDGDHPEYVTCPPDSHEMPDCTDGSIHCGDCWAEYFKRIRGRGTNG